MAKPEKLPSGRWRVRFTDQRGKRHTFTTETYRQAKIALATIETRVAKGTYTDPDDDITVAEWGAQFWPTTYRHLQPASIKYQDSAWRTHVLPQWGDHKLRSIRWPEVDAWIAKMLNRGMAPMSVSQQYHCFTKLMRGAMMNDPPLIDYLPLPNKTGIPTGKIKAVRFLDDKEIEKLAQQVGPEYRALVTLGCYTGLRIRELFALRYNDFDWKGSKVIVDEAQHDDSGIISYGRTKTKASQFRRIPMPDGVIEDVMHHIDSHEVWPAALVFQSPEGGALRLENWRRRVWNPAVLATGLTHQAGVAAIGAVSSSRPGLTPHDMRHTATSLWISEGVDRSRIIEWLGHRDTRMIDRVYGHLFPRDDEMWRERMSARLRRAR